MKKVHNRILSLLSLQIRIVNRKEKYVHTTLRLKSLQCYSFQIYRYYSFFFFQRKAVALAFIATE